MHTSSFKVKDFLQKEKIGKAADITICLTALPF